MPFGPKCEYANFEACIKANGDKNDPEAYCAVLERETKDHCSSSGEDRLRNASGKKWYRIENAAATPNEEDEPAEIYVYDEISYWGITAQDFVKDLMGIDKDRIVLHMNTPGGDVFDGIAIYNALRQHKAQVTVYVDSLAASIGSVIAMAGDKVVMAKYSTMMIHDAMGAVFGNANDMNEMAALLDKTSQNLAQVYADRIGVDPDEIRKVMKAETWFSAEEAVEFGLADEVAQDDNRRIDNKWDMSNFRFKNREEAPSPTLGIRPATLRERVRNVSVDPPVIARKAGAPPEGGGVVEPTFQFDPASFTTAMRYAADPPVETVEAPFDFDPLIFRAMMIDRSASAPALAQTPKKAEDPMSDAFSPEFLRNVIIQRGVATSD